MPTTGLAAVADSFGAPLMLEETEFRDPLPGEVLVKMEATGVCHTDLHAIAGDWDAKATLPLTPGHEGVGTVVKAGLGVQHVKEGDRVGLPWLHSACGYCEFCTGGWESLCATAEYGGFSVPGSFAEYALAPGNFAAPIPAGIGAAEAAPILCAGLTSWKGIKEADVRPGEWLAVSGIGGLGHLAVQYAKVAGLNVVAIDVDKDKLKLARDLGADRTVDARNPDAAREVEKLTGGGCHGVLVTAPSLPAVQQGVAMVRRKGTCVLVGLPPGEVSLPLVEVVLKRITLRGSLVGTRTDLTEALQLADGGKVKASVHCLPFRDVNKALDELRSGNVNGRLVLTF